MQTRLYLSGGITKVKNFKSVFDEALNTLLSSQYLVLDPRQISKCLFKTCGGVIDESGRYLHTWECNLRYDLGELVFCDGIAMIPEWETSEGATLELNTARGLHLPFNTVRGWVEGTEQLVYTPLSHTYTVILNKKEELNNGV